MYTLSVLPSILPQTLAAVNKKSLRRLTYFNAASSISPEMNNDVMLRSARRHVVRAKWRHDPVLPPDGRIKLRRGGRNSSYSSIQLSSSFVRDPSGSNSVLLILVSCFVALRGVAICDPISCSKHWI